MFHNSLIESGSKPARGVLRLSLGVAAALHAAAVLAIVAASAWTVGDPPQPADQVVFIESRVPSVPAALGDGRPAARSAGTRTRQPARSFVQPVEVPREIPLASDSVASIDPPGSDVSGAGDAVGGGQGEGSPDGVPGGTEVASAQRDVVIPASSATEPPILTRRVEPAYPDAARRIHSEGEVILEAVISGTGVVEEVRVVHSVNPLLDAAAVHAVEQWRYHPATLNGRAVRVALTVTVRFSLH